MSSVHTYLFLEDGATVLLYEDSVTDLLLVVMPDISIVAMD